LHEYFRPPALGESHCGWTLPWPVGTVPGLPGDYAPQPRPEGVHRPESFGQVRALKRL
jgi:hypothetical protein